MVKVRLSIVLLLCCQINVAATISNIMFLGDSLSDIGNFPHASSLWNNDYQDVSQNMFIPATNPIHRHAWSAFSIDGDKFNYPIPGNPSYLPPLPRVNQRPYVDRSLNWTEFLLYDLKGRQAKVIPRQMANQGVGLYGQDISVNYAWWAAVTGKGCYDENYHLVKKACRAEDVNKQVKQSDQIIIPGIGSQVEWIKTDINNGKVYHDDNTLYIIYAGGNGLYQAQSQFDHLSFSSLLRSISLFSGGGSQEIVDAVDRLSQPPINAKQILVINLYNLSLTPRIVHQRWLSMITQGFSQLFNYRLRKAIRALAFDKPNIDIKLFDNYALFEYLASSEFFKTTLGKQCDGHSKLSPYYQSPGHSNNCFVDKHHGYLYWNNSHPSTLAHAKLARALSRWLLKSNE